MKAQQLEEVWLDGRETVTLSELSRVCGMGADELDELVDYGALEPLEPLEPERQDRLFSAECVKPLCTAGRLRQDFDLDLFTVVILLGYLHRIETLERQVRSLQAHLPSHALAAPCEGLTPWRE